MAPVEVPDLETGPPVIAATVRSRILPVQLPAPNAAAQRRALLAAVFGVSLSVLAFEIALTRLFAAVLAYHFVFVAVSVGLLGLGGGGILLAWLPQRTDGRAVLRQLGMFALGEAGTLALALAFFLRYPESDRLLPFALAALPPFLFAGLFLSLALRRFAGMGSRVYFADLTGAATGTLVAVLLLQALGPPPAVLLLAGTVTLAAAICLASGGSRRTAAVATALGLLIVAVAAGKPQAPWLQMELAGKRSASKHLLGLFADPKARVRPVATTWDAYGRTDVVDVGEDGVSKRVIFTDGGGAAVMPRFPRTVRDAERVMADIGVLPFLRGTKDRVLVIGPGGGQDVLLALLAGAKEITAVEVNPAAVRAVDRFAEYNGGLYRYRNVKVVVGEGRNYVRRTHERYDLIYLPLVVTQAAEGVGYSLVENYVFTVEAFRDYLAHLRPGGRLVIKAHDTLDLTRAFLTALAVQHREGRTPADAARQLLVFQRHPLLQGDPGGVMYPLLILRDTPYTPEETETAFTQAVAAGMFPLFVPGVYDALGVRALGQDGQSLQAFAAAFPARITPTTDDSPFFYEFSRPLPPHLGWLLAGVVALLLLVTGVAGKVEGRRVLARTRWSSVAYFGALGGAFMLVEIPVLQRSIFALGFPTLAFSVVLFALLAGAGIGSYLSAWIDDAGLERAAARASLLAGLLAATWLAIGPALLEQWAGGGLLSRSLVAMGLLFPLGATMGVPFPLGIRLLKRAGRTPAVPWMWAVNGVVSVAASVGAVAIAIVAGFSWAMALGVVLYAAAAGLARFGFGGLDSSTGLGTPA